MRVINPLGNGLQLGVSVRLAWGGICLPKLYHILYCLGKQIVELFLGDCALLGNLARFFLRGLLDGGLDLGFDLLHFRLDDGGLLGGGLLGLFHFLGGFRLRFHDGGGDDRGRGEKGERGTVVDGFDFRIIQLAQVGEKPVVGFRRDGQAGAGDLALGDQLAEVADFALGEDHGAGTGKEVHTAVHGGRLHGGIGRIQVRTVLIHVQ